MLGVDPSRVAAVLLPASTDLEQKLVDSFGGFGKRGRRLAVAVDIQRTWHVYGDRATNGSHLETVAGLAVAALCQIEGLDSVTYKPAA